MEKTEGWKSRYTVPLITKDTIFNVYIVKTEAIKISEHWSLFYSICNNCVWNFIQIEIERSECAQCALQKTVQGTHYKFSYFNPEIVTRAQILKTVSQCTMYMAQHVGMSETFELKINGKLKG
jgi:hypothetical protein